MYIKSSNAIFGSIVKYRFKRSTEYLSEEIKGLNSSSSREQVIKGQNSGSSLVKYVPSISKVRSVLELVN